MVNVPFRTCELTEAHQRTAVERNHDWPRRRPGTADVEQPGANSPESAGFGKVSPIAMTTGRAPWLHLLHQRVKVQ